MQRIPPFTSQYEPAKVRVGVISPNLTLHVHRSEGGNLDTSWVFDSIAKRVSLLFDKIYLTENLETTCELIESGFDDGSIRSETLLYLAKQGFILTPMDLGYSSGEEFVNGNLTGRAHELHSELLSLGNPGTGDETPGYYIGQADVGRLAASNGWHPRSSNGWNDPQISIQELQYETILLRRNAAILNAAGFPSTTIVGQVYGSEAQQAESGSLVWKIVINEMPQLDGTIPWDEVLDFRGQDETKALARRLRRWTRQAVCEPWRSSELVDEIQELQDQYFRHMRAAKIAFGSGPLEFLVVGAAELAEDLLKLRLSKIARLVTIMGSMGIKLSDAEAKAPGRAFALYPFIKARFGSRGI